MVLIGVLIGIILHEIGHVIAIKITKAGKILKIHLSLKGVGIEWEPFDENDYIKRIIITLSGSGLNLLAGALCFAGGLVEIGLVNVLFGLLNLLIPLKNSDGRRAFETLRDYTMESRVK
jgi:hypothetical protein